jgi:acyl-CoA thioester hydrolase
VAQPVQWGDLDVMGHVNNTVYLRWLENGRFSYFERVGIGELLRRERRGPILARIEVDFLRPVAFPDDLLVSTRTVRLGRTSFVLRSAIWSIGAAAPCARADAVIVLVDYAAGGPVALPESLRAAIRDFDAPPA